MSKSKQQAPTAADVKRDWTAFMTEESFISRPMELARRLYKDRMTQVRFTCISLQYTLQQQIAEKNQAIALGTEMMDQRNKLMELFTELHGAFILNLGKRVRLAREIRKLVAEIRKSEEEYDDHGNPSQGAGGNAGGPQLESVAVESVANAVSDEAVGNTPEGEGDPGDLPSGGDGVQSAEGDPEARS